MTLLAKLNADGTVACFPYSQRNIPNDFPGWTVAKQIQPTDLLPENVVRVVAVPPPALNAGEVLEGASTAEWIEGVLTQTWHTRPMTTEELDALIPMEVSMRQARLAMLDAGIIASVDTAIAALPSPQKEAAQIEWEYATTVRRDSTLVATLATSLGLTEQQVGNLFTAAGAIA